MNDARQCLDDRLPVVGRDDQAIAGGEIAVPDVDVALGDALKHARRRTGLVLDADHDNVLFLKDPEAGLLQDVYAQTIEQVALLDRLGLDQVWFSEHHFVEDGYLPSFAPVAGAVAAVTSQMRISTVGKVRCGRTLHQSCVGSSTDPVA